MTTAVNGKGWVCEFRVPGGRCAKPAIQFEGWAGIAGWPRYLCVEHLAEAIKAGVITLFTPNESEAASGKVVEILDRINDIERLCANCGAEVNGEPLPDPDAPTFEVSW